MKNNRGISLIALVLTTVILIILAAFSVKMIHNSDLVNETIDMKNGYESFSNNEAQKYDSLKNKVLQGTY